MAFAELAQVQLHIDHEYLRLAGCWAPPGHEVTRILAAHPLIRGGQAELLPRFLVQMKP